MSSKYKKNMNDNSGFLQNRWLKGGLLGLFIGLCGSLLGLSPLGNSLELNVGKTWLFKMRGELSPPNNIAIIGINSQTSKQLGLPASPRDWPRSIHAKAIDKLVEHGASVIAFDVFFGSPKVHADDMTLARSIDKASRVVLVQKLTGKRQPITDLEGRIKGIVWVEELLRPVPEIARASKGLGPFPLPKIDAAVHDFYSFKSSAGEAATMPVVATQLLKQNIYPEWLALVKTIPGPDKEDLPSSITMLGNDNSVGRLLISIRNLYVKYPSLGQQIEQLIEKKYNDNITDKIKNDITILNNLYGGKALRLLNFYGPPGTFPTIPFQSLIKGNDPNYSKEDFNFDGKIVYVGFSDLYDPGQPDRFYSIFTNDNGIDLSGVEIAATATANLLTGQTLITASPLERFVLLLVFGFIITIILYILPAIYGVPITLSIALVFAFVAQWLFSEQQLWLPIATPLLIQFPLALFLGLMGHYILERRRGQHMMEALNYYVPENVAMELTENRLAPGDANKVVYSTCFATDMAGFSTLAETMEPGELAIVLNDYFDALSQPLKKHHVDVTEFRADAIMCAWTAAEPTADIRQKAILAALDTIDALSHFKERHSNVNTNIRIGLEAGTVYVGHAGGGGHFVFSIVGDCANTASRVESLNKHLGTNLLATGTVVDGLDNLLLRELSDFQFVGKTEALPIVELVSAYDTASNEQLLFCEQFSEALALFHAARWKEALTAFAGFLGTYPTDGPASYYLSLCQQYISGNTDVDDPRIIRMKAK